MTAYVIKMTGAFALVVLAYLSTRLLYRNAESPLLTDDVVVTEVSAYEIDARVTEIVFSPDRERAFALTAQGQRFIVGRVGNRFYCHPTDNKCWATAQ